MQEKLLCISIKTQRNPIALQKSTYINLGSILNIIELQNANNTRTVIFLISKYKDSHRSIKVGLVAIKEIATC